MGATQKTVGSNASGLGDDWTKFLQNGLNSGTFGAGAAAGGVANANPVGATQGIAGILNQLLAGGGGAAGNAMMDKVSQQQTKDVDALRARYSMGGGQAFGTAAGAAESTYRAEAAPQAALALHQMQLSALMPLLQLLSGTANKGITQAENVMQPSTGANILQAVPGIAQAAGTIAMMNKGGGGGGTIDPASVQIPQLNLNPTVNSASDPFGMGWTR